MAEEALVHQLPLPRLLLAPQRLRLGRDVGRHHGQHRVLHVLQHRAPQLRRQRLDEGHRVHGGVRARGLGQLPPLLLRALLRQDLRGWDSITLNFFSLLVVSRFLLGLSHFLISAL